MEEHLLAFLKHLEQEYHYSENTIAAYRNDLSQFHDYAVEHGGMSASDWSLVSSEMIEEYLDFMTHKDQPYASSTVARKVAAIKSFFNYLASQSAIEENPAINIDSPKVKKRLPQTLTHDEVDQLLEAPTVGDSPKNVRDQALLHVLYATGMRVSEVVSLQLGDVRMDDSILVSPTRQGTAREIPMDAETQQLLAHYLEEARPHLVREGNEQALFLNHRGEKLTRQGLWLIIKGYARQAQLKTEVTPHTLRHSFASHRLAKGAKLEEIQRLLGHANISTTQIYSQLEVAEENAGG